MTKKQTFLSCMVLLTVLSAVSAWAAGEEILARTGHYIFFIQPDPCTGVTYSQKLVPCVLEDTVYVPRKVFPAYQVPEPVRRSQGVVVTETPVGCALGESPCVECFPRPTQRRETRDVWGPRPVAVRVPTLEWVPKKVTKKIMLPQWFAVQEQPIQRPPVRKVGAGG
jgi:hypothetical protein